MSAKIVRVLVKAGVLAAGAAALGLAFSSAASAEGVEPSSAMQSTSMKMLAGDGPPAVPQWLTEAGQTAEAAEVVAAEEAAVLESEVAGGEAAAAAVTAPEQRLSPAPPRYGHHDPAEAAPSALERAAGTLRTGSEQIGSFLSRVVSACQVGFGAGAGGPALVLGVLGLAVALAGHRVLGTRWASDEDVPRFLYAWELTPPG